jgi:hypothetical protein
MLYGGRRGIIKRQVIKGWRERLYRIKEDNERLGREGIYNQLIGAK